MIIIMMMIMSSQIQLTSLSNLETKEMSVINLVLRLADGL